MSARMMTAHDAHLALLGTWSLMERETDDRKRSALAAQANRYQTLVETLPAGDAIVSAS